MSQLTVWFPLHLRRAIAIVAPKVDPYTELGTRRTKHDMNREYQRLLNRDRNPLQFLYHGMSIDRLLFLISSSPDEDVWHL